MAHRAENNYSLTLYRSSLLTLDQTQIQALLFAEQIPMRTEGVRAGPLLWEVLLLLKASTVENTSIQSKPYCDFESQTYWS